MRTIFKTLILGAVAASFLTGCGSSNQPILPTTPKVAKAEKNGIITVEQKVNRFSDKLKADSNFEKFAIAYKEGLNAAFRKAANETLKSGNTHFILVSKGSDGFKGFPLNKVSDVHEFCLGSYLTDKELKNKCKKDGLFNLNAGYINLSFLPLKNPSYTIAAFDANSVLKEDIK